MSSVKAGIDPARAEVSRTKLNIRSDLSIRKLFPPVLFFTLSTLNELQD